MTSTATLTKVTKVEAARILQVSPRTINRKIAAGELETERETDGRRRVLVLLDSEIVTEGPEDESAELLILRERAAGLEDLVEHLKEQLDLERRRYSELYHDVKMGALALPAPDSPRRWWKFWE